METGNEMASFGDVKQNKNIYKHSTIFKQWMRMTKLNDEIKWNVNVNESVDAAMEWIWQNTVAPFVCFT